MNQVSWLPWWVLLCVGLVLFVALIAYTLMPFAVFGTRPRLDEIERQLDEIRAELRHLARHLSGEVPQPHRPADYAPPPPAHMTPVELTPEPARPDFSRSGPARNEPSRPEVRPEYRPSARVARASDDWGQAPRQAAPSPRVPPVRLNDPWSTDDVAARSSSPSSAERPVESPFLAGDPAGRAGASVSGDRPYEDMPPEGLSQIVRPTHFEPPDGHPGSRREPPRVPQPEWERKTSPDPYAARPEAAHSEAPKPEIPREAPWRREAPAARPDGSATADWERPAVERQAEDRAGEWNRADHLPDERSSRARDDDGHWRKPRSEPTLRWPPRQ